MSGGSAEDDAKAESLANAPDCGCCGCCGCGASGSGSAVRTPTSGIRGGIELKGYIDVAVAAVFVVAVPELELGFGRGKPDLRADSEEVEKGRDGVVGEGLDER